VSDSFGVLRKLCHILDADYLRIKAALGGLHAIFSDDIHVNLIELPSQEEYESWLATNKTVSTLNNYENDSYHTLFRKLVLLIIPSLFLFGLKVEWSWVALPKLLTGVDLRFQTTR
jgi:hypothetical protein